MSNSAISEESIYFVPVEKLCTGPAITCAPDTDIVEMARIMRDHDISCIVVTENKTPVGIVSVRDCRNLIADSQGSVAGIRVRDIMSTGVFKVRRRDYLFTAIFMMSTHNIHRLVVVDDDGRLFGVITDTDLVRIKIRTPLYINQELEAAQSIDELRMIGTRLLDMVRFAANAGAETKSLVQLISHFNDRFTLRIIYLLEQNEGIRLPEGAAYLALGSEGRGEQTLRTDQDSAVVYRNDLPPEKLGEIERFATRLVDSLVEIGVPRCPGDTMASNPRWRHSLTEWKEFLNQWISIPTPEHVVDFGMFQDLRVVHGDKSLGKDLHDHILAIIKRHAFFLPNMARSIVRFQPPLGMFGRIKGERSGENRGKVDIKKAGIFALTVGASLLSLEAGIVGGSTWDKLEQLGKRGIIAPSDLETVVESYTFLVKLRLQRQLRSLTEGKPATNHVDPHQMSTMERDQFRQALKGAGFFLRIINDHYQLDMTSR